MARFASGDFAVHLTTIECSQSTRIFANKSPHPRLTIGSVNFSEFFVTFAESATFVLALNFFEYWQIILGLLIGGSIAAPIVAVMAKKLPIRALMIFVGALIIILSIRTIYLTIK